MKLYSDHHAKHGGNGGANNVDDSEAFSIEIHNYIKNRENQIKANNPDIKNVKKTLIINEENETTG